MKATGRRHLPQGEEAGSGRPQPKKQGDGLALPIGKRLEAARKSRRLTLEALAAKVGFTKGYLSKLETGAKVPPIATLATVASALGVDIASLLVPQDRAALGDENHGLETSVVRAEERHRIVRGGSIFGYDYQSLTQHSSFSKRMQPFIFRFPPQLLREVYFEHSGEELMFVLSGRIEIEIGQEKNELAIGDCIHFNAALRHRARGIGGEATALVIILDEKL